MTLNIFVYYFDDAKYFCVCVICIYRERERKGGQREYRARERARELGTRGGLFFKSIDVTDKLVDYLYYLNPSYEPRLYKSGSFVFFSECNFYAYNTEGFVTFKNRTKSLIPFSEGVSAKNIIRHAYFLFGLKFRNKDLLYPCEKPRDTKKRTCVMKKQRLF